MLTLRKKLEENAELGADIINKYLKGEKKGSDQVKYASLSITQFVKHEFNNQKLILPNNSEDLP